MVVSKDTNVKKLLIASDLIIQISNLLDKDSPNVKTKISQLLHRAKAHCILHLERDNKSKAEELKRQIDIGFSFLNDIK